MLEIAVGAEAANVLSACVASEVDWLRTIVSGDVVIVFELDGSEGLKYVK